MSSATEKTPEPKVVVDAELTLRAISFLKKSFVYVLRRCFEHVNTPEEYRYNTVEDQTRIAIYRAFPKRVTRLPLIVVETSSAQASFTTLQDETAFEKFDEDGNLLGQVVTGCMWIPVSVNVFAETATDRDRIVDLITIYMRHLFKGLFNKYQMPFLRIEPGENGTDQVGSNRRVYKGFVKTTVQLEYDQFIDQSMFDLVQSIDLFQMRVGSSVEDLQSNNIAGEEP